MIVSSEIRNLISNVVKRHIPEDGIGACNIEPILNQAIEVIRVGICYTKTVDRISPERISKLLLEINDELEKVGELRGVSVRHYFMEEQELEMSSAC